MSEIVLPRPIANRLLAQALEGDRNEICGLLASRDGVPVSIYPVPNQAADPAHRFHMDPRAQIDAMRRMRESGEELFAIYHSHPATPAIPSTLDLQEAGYPAAVYLIISLGTRGLLEMRAFQLLDGAFEPVDLVVE